MKTLFLMEPLQDVLRVLIKIAGVDEDVIKVDKDELVNCVPQDVIHKVLKKTGSTHIPPPLSPPRALSA